MMGWWEYNDRIATLKRLWAEGLSATQIRDIMGAASRSAVCGKIHRLGLPTRSLAARQSVPAPRRTRARNLTGAMASNRRPKTPSQPKPEKDAYAGRREPVVIDVSSAKPWTERAFGECAYIVAGEGDGAVSCCGDTKGHRYCAGHREIMFRPSRPPNIDLGRFAA